MIHLRTPAGIIPIAIPHKAAIAIGPHLAPGCSFEVPARTLGEVVTGAKTETPAKPPKQITVVGPDGEKVGP